MLRPLVDIVAMISIALYTRSSERVLVNVLGGMVMGLILLDLIDALKLP